MSVVNKEKQDVPQPENPEVLARAVRKVMEGKKDELTGEERDALKRHEKDKEERLRWQFYESIPQKHWRTMSGRQTKVLNEQAARYGIPVGGAAINLPKVVKALHDFLATNKHKLARDDDDMLSGPSSPALERYREERAALAKLTRLEREGQLVQRDLVRQSLGKVAAILRTAGETLHKQFGSVASEILIEAIGDAESEVDRFFSSPQEEAPTDASD